MVQTNITRSLLAELEQRKNILSTILKTSSELLEASTLEWIPKINSILVVCLSIMVKNNHHCTYLFFDNNQPMEMFVYDKIQGVFLKHPHYHQGDESVVHQLSTSVIKVFKM